MSFHAFNMGCNIVGYSKNNKNYGMCCAWAMMIGYDTLAMLLGSQSVTGNNIQVGDVIGVSALANGQMDIANELGDGHSNERDKFQNVKHHTVGSAILVDGAKTQMVCEVIDIIKKDYTEEDNLIVLKVKEHKESEGKFQALE